MDIKWYLENGKNDLRGAPKLIKPTGSSAKSNSARLVSQNKLKYFLST